jgi:hypothetical protein
LRKRNAAGSQRTEGSAPMPMRRPFAHVLGSPEGKTKYDEDLQTIAESIKSL